MLSPPRQRLFSTGARAILPDASSGKDSATNTCLQAMRESNENVGVLSLTGNYASNSLRARVYNRGNETKTKIFLFPCASPNSLGQAD